MSEEVVRIIGMRNRCNNKCCKYRRIINLGDSNYWHMFLSIWLLTIYSLFYRICVLENIVFNIHCVNPYSLQWWRYFFFEMNLNFWGFYLFYLLILYFNGSVLKLLGYREKLYQRLKLNNSIVENIFQFSF